VNVLKLTGPIAHRQHGLITLEQALRVGVTPDQVLSESRSGGLVRVWRGVYRHVGAPVTWAQAVLAAVLASGPGAAASHTTAARIWELKVVGDLEALHVTARRQIRLDGVRSHIVPLSARERTRLNGIPITTAERTVLDLAGMLTVTELGGCVDDGLRRRLIRLERLRQLVERAPTCGRRSIRPMRLVLADRPCGYDPGGSDWEKEMDRLWEDLGLPPAVRQYPVTANGHRYILDRAIPELRIGVEWNGFAAHGGRSAFDYDSNRRADLTAAGWHMLDFTSRSDPDRLVAAVRGAIRTRESGRRLDTG
jgi:hypothetical protein